MPEDLQSPDNVFGSNAAVVDSKNHQRNAQVLIATYHPLRVAKDDDDAKLARNGWSRAKNDYFL